MSSPSRRPVKIIDLAAQHHALRGPLTTAFRRVLANSHFILGPEVRACEHEIADVCNARFGVGVNSGTDALVLALRALNLRKGDEVIVPDFTFMATASAVILAGATPVLADVEPQTLTLDPAQVLRRLTRRTRAIIPVHLYGQPADLDALLRIARARRLAVIEDACQSLGATWRRRPVGALGYAGCLSFFPTKNLGALGDGGMVLTNDPRLARRVRRLRDHGAEEKYLHRDIGYNSRLDEIQAAALRVKLKSWPAWTRRRQALAARYTRALAGVPVRLPVLWPNATHVFHQYVIQTPRREALRAYLAERGIHTALHYPRPLHRQPALANLPGARGRFPVSDRAAREILCLPIAAELSDQDAGRVIAAIRDFFASAGRARRRDSK